MEGQIKEFKFLLKENVIEVYDNETADFPYTYIFLKPGQIRNEKDFHYEIMDWFTKHNE